MIKGRTAAFFNLHRRESLSPQRCFVADCSRVREETDKDGLLGLRLLNYLVNFR
jgi:hypothetical protein